MFKKILLIFFRNYYTRIKRYKVGFFRLNGKRFKYVDAASFAFIFEEIFHKQIYRFNCSHNSPTIIDAGANIGLSVIYFKQIYPNAKIIAFEPDEKVFDALSYNVNLYELKDVELVKKAIWNKETILEFHSEGADGGRVAVKGDQTNIIKVPTVSLRNYLSNKIDFLKIDIEGAESTVLEDCADLLHNVDRIFVEYHSFINQPQSLQKILAILHNNGFRYNIQHIGIFSTHPFLKINNYLGMDNQLNIFAVKDNL